MKTIIDTKIISLKKPSKNVYDLLLDKKRIDDLLPDGHIKGYFLSFEEDMEGILEKGDELDLFLHPVLDEDASLCLELSVLEIVENRKISLVLSGMSKYDEEKEEWVAMNIYKDFIDGASVEYLFYDNGLNSDIEIITRIESENLLLRLTLKIQLLIKKIMPSKFTREFQNKIEKWA
ncbi:MAG: hypothetical protein JXR18_14550 [Neptuniibacter sp.]